MSETNLGGPLFGEAPDILARVDKDAKVSKKRRTGSISRAFSWLKGKKKKRSSTSSAGSGGGSKKGGHPKSKEQRGDSANQAISKPDDDSQLTVHYKAVQHYQENVFLPGNRPQYLEDLHSEAQEGLKSLQQQENQSGNGLDHGDDQSVKSSRTLQPEDEGMFRDRARSVASESTRADTMSLRSELVRTGSTFKPPQTTKNRPAKEKRSRRTTIMGIPQHVQKELGIEKGRDSKRHKAHKKADVADPAQLVNGAEDVVVVPTIDGEVQQKHHKGARVHLQAIEAMHLSKEEQTNRMLKHHIRTVYKDDSVLDHSVAPRVSPMQRPKSLAVPGMTTHSYNEPHSPVMSMSPQATYLSKIIPNAILPSSVEVIEISRSKSRNSVRTVSKSSLVSASPGSTRSSLRFYNFNTSDLSSSSSSNWSHSQSSETIVSNSSTLSSGGTKTPNGEEGKEVHRLAPDKMSINSWMSASSGMPQNANGFMMVKQRGDGRNASPAPSTGSAVEGSDTMSIQSDMSFNRNLSVTKMKRPPAPPRRTYSLHHKNKQRDLQGKAVTESQENQSPISETSSVRSDRLAYSADYSSPDVPRCSAAASPLTAVQMEAREAVLKEQQASSDVSPQKLPFPGNKFERTMSPSSGYSSQSGTPTFSPKGEISYPSSAGRKKAQPVKPERSCSRSSPAASISSSRTSLSSSVSEPVQHETLLAVSPLAHPPANPLPTKLKPASPVPRVSESVHPALAAVEYDEVFVIPPPPKVHAPSPPPPETWMLNKRTFDSLRSSTSQLATSGDDQQQLKKEPAPAQKEETPPVLKTVEPPVQTETLIVKKEVPPVFKKEYKPACVDSLFIIKKEVLPVFKKQTPPVIKKEVPPEQTETHPILKKETPPVVKKEPPPVQKKETPPVVKKETSPVVKKETPPIVQKETPPVFKKETLPIVKSETPPLIKKEVPPVFKETIPVQEIPLVVKKESPPVIKREIQPEVKEDVHPVLKNETPPVQRKEVLPEQNVVQDVEPIPAVQASPSPPPSPPPAHLPPPPPTKKTPSESSASSPPPLPDPEVCQVLPAAEPLWPPPPPSLEEPVLFFTSQEESDFSFPPPPPPVDHISQTSIETLSTVELPAKSAGSEVVPTPPPENSSESTAILVTVVESSETTKPTFLLQRAQEIPAAPPLPTSNDKPKEPIATSGSPSLSITAQPTPQKPPEAPCPPPAPPLVNIKRQQSLINQEVKAKEPLSRTKSTPAPKEEASIPLVTPSLLQMVRLRSVNVGSYQPDEQPKSPVEENKPSPVNGTTLSPTVPQKPVRKSLSFKSPSGTSSALPSMKLQEAIRMKTAAMSSKDMPPHSLSRPNLRASFTPTSPPSSNEYGQTSLRSPEEGGVLKSPTSTASFIFSRSSKKVVIETSVSPEAQTDLKKNLVAELMSTSQKKTGKVPPPVAKKPTHIPSSPSPQGAPLSPLMKMAGPLKEQQAASPTQGGQGGSESSVAPDSTPAPTGPAGTVQLAGQQAQPKEGIALKSNHEAEVTEAVTS